MRNLLKNKLFTTGNDPLVSYLAQIRLLCSSQNLITILHEEHSMTKLAAQKLSKEVSPFLQQGLAFYDTAIKAPLSVKPVIQYYAYLNFASAIVRIYQPPNWQSLKSHGVEDLTRSKNKIGLNTDVVKIYNGVVPLFHALISDEPINGDKLSLKTIFSAIPMMSGELRQFFNQSIFAIDIDQSVQMVKNYYRSSITYKISPEMKTPLPVRKLFRAVPSLRTEYQLYQKTSELRQYISRKKWSQNNKMRAEQFHNRQVFKMINYGSTWVDPISHRVYLEWTFNPQTRMLPVLTASLILSFALSSLSRYRAKLLTLSENTRLLSMFEVFINESDYFMIPAFRNLLYGDSLHINRKPWI